MSHILDPNMPLPSVIPYYYDLPVTANYITCSMNYKYHEKNWNLCSKATFLFYTFYFYYDFIEDIILTISLYSVFNSHIPCDALAGTTFQGNNANIFMQVQHGNWVVHRISAWKLKKCAFKMSVNAPRYKAKRPTMGTYFRSAFTERRDFLFTRTLSVNKYILLDWPSAKRKNVTGHT